MRIFNKLSIVTFAATFYLLLGSFNSFAQNVGINNTGATPDNSALLDLSSEDKGFLITRADTGNIDTPAFGLMTLAPADSCLYMYSGATWISLGGVGSKCGTSGDSGTEELCKDYETEVVDVINPTTGKTWMDRNLGASQAATSSTDEAAYGDLYQWGRCSDGHEKRTSSTTPTLSTTDTPGNGDFIKGSNDWRSPPNDNLWQGVSGINNPCPTGYRIPTEVELANEMNSWVSQQNAAGAFASPLKLPLAGYRLSTDGSLFNVGSFGSYWGSNIVSTSARSWYFSSSVAGFSFSSRAGGYSVRCIKD